MLRSCCLTLIRHMTFLAFEVKLNTSQCRSHSHNWQGTSPIISLSCWNIMTYLAVFIIHGTQGSHCLLVIWLFWHFAMQLTSISALESIAKIRCHCLVVLGNLGFRVSLVWHFAVKLTPISALEFKVKVPVVSKCLTLICLLWHFVKKFKSINGFGYELWVLLSYCLWTICGLRVLWWRLPQSMPFESNLRLEYFCLLSLPCDFFFSFDQSMYIFGQTLLQLLP